MKNSQEKRIKDCDGRTKTTKDAGKKPKNQKI